MRLLLILLIFTFTAEAGPRKSSRRLIKYVMTEFSPAKVDIGFGEKTDNIGMQDNECKMDFVSNGPLIHINGLFVGGSCTDGKKFTNFIDKLDAIKVGGNFYNTNVKKEFRNGIFTIQKNGKSSLCSIEDKNCVPKTCEDRNFAIQNGPLLLKNKSNPHSRVSKSRKTRSALGIKSNGQIVHILTLSPTTFWETAELFKKHEAIDAIYLDGERLYAGIISNGSKNNIKKWGSLAKDNGLKGNYLQYYNCENDRKIISREKAIVIKNH